jgi:hypothetical protein
LATHFRLAAQFIGAFKFLDAPASGAPRFSSSMHPVFDAPLFDAPLFDATASDATMCLLQSPVSTPPSGP